VGGFAKEVHSAGDISRRAFKEGKEIFLPLRESGGKLGLPLNGERLKGEGGVKWRGWGRVLKRRDQLKERFTKRFKNSRAHKASLERLFLQASRKGLFGGMQKR